MNVDTHPRVMSTLFFTVISTTPKKMAGTSCLEETVVDIIVVGSNILLCHVFVNSFNHFFSFRPALIDVGDSVSQVLALRL